MQSRGALGGSEDGDAAGWQLGAILNEAFDNTITETDYAFEPGA